jgi:arylsulfatase A-like enzyme
VREGRYKLIISPELARLYDLEQDPKESHDLSAAMADRVAALRKAWDEWNARLSSARSSARFEETTHNGDVFRWQI